MKAGPSREMSLSVSFFFFFCITLKPRVESYTKSKRLEYEPVSEPLRISVKQSRVGLVQKSSDLTTQH